MTAASAGASQQNREQVISESVKMENCDGADDIKRKYSQQQYLKTFSRCDVKELHHARDAKEGDCCTEITAVDKGRSSTLQMDRDLQNVDDLTPDEAHGSCDESNREGKTMGTPSMFSFRLNGIASSPGFRKLYDLYLENAKCYRNLSPLSSQSEDSGENRSSPRYRCGDPMWAQYTSLESWPSPERGLTEMSNSYSPSLSSQLLDCSCPLAPPRHTEELLFDQENLSPQVALDLNISGSTTSSNSPSSSPKTPKKSVCSVGPEACRCVECPSGAQLSPWNTKSFEPYSPSLFSVRVTLFCGETSVDEASSNTVSSQGIDFKSK